MCTFSYNVYTCGCDSKNYHFHLKGCGDGDGLNCQGVVEDITRLDHECSDCRRKRKAEERRAEEKAKKKAEKEAEKKVEWRPWRWGRHEK